MFVNLSILGLYQYDNSVFDGFAPPVGVDKELCVNSILTECAELSLVYTDPETFKTLVSIWSSRNSRTWEKLHATTQLEYNPIHNYDRTEEWTDEETGNANANGENVEQAQGYNSSSFEDRAKNTSTSSANSTRNNTRTGRAFGNIGVTTTQEMLEAERRTVRFNIIDEIVSDFKKQFCIMIY